eukprot:5735199-Pyramimonas_sp.AAC.1
MGCRPADPRTRAPLGTYEGDVHERLLHHEEEVRGLLEVFLGFPVGADDDCDQETDADPPRQSWHAVEEHVQRHPAVPLRAPLRA